MLLKASNKVLYKASGTNCFILDHVLSKLDPKVSGSELLDIVKALASSVITLPAEPSAQSHEEHSEYEQLMEKTMSALTEFFQEVLLKDTTVETLDLLHQVSHIFLCYVFELNCELI